MIRHNPWLVNGDPDFDLESVREQSLMRDGEKGEKGDSYVIAEFREAKTGVLHEPVGDAGIEPSAHILERLRQVPVVQSHLYFPQVRYT